MDKPVRPQWNGAALKALRVAKGWSQDTLAAIVGGNRSQVYKWEDSETTPGADYMAAFSVVFGVPPMHFVTGIDLYQQYVVAFQRDTPKDEEEPQLHAERLKKRLASGEVQKRAATAVGQRRGRPPRPRPPSPPSARKPGGDRE